MKAYQQKKKKTIEAWKSSKEEWNGNEILRFDKLKSS